MSTYVDGTTYITVICGADGCGLTFGMPEHFYDKTKRTRETWYCPQGHPRVWRGLTHKEELQRAKSRAQHLEEQLGAAVQDAERTRQALLKDRERFAAGVCPSCHRSFENVRRHMKSKHPSYDITRVEAAHQFSCSCGRSFSSMRGLRIHQGRKRSEGWDQPSTPTWRSHLTKV